MIKIDHETWMEVRAFAMSKQEECVKVLLSNGDPIEIAKRQAVHRVMDELLALPTKTVPIDGTGFEMKEPQAW